MICYYFIIYVVVVSVSPLSGRFLFYRIPVQSLLCTPKYRTTLDSTCVTACGARLRGGGLGGMEAPLASYVF